MPGSTVGLRLSEDTRRRLEALGKVRDRSPHYLMKAAVEHYLDAEEAIEAERRLMRERWDRYVIAGHAVDHADVEAWVSELGGDVDDRPD